MDRSQWNQETRLLPLMYHITALHPPELPVLLACEAVKFALGLRPDINSEFRWVARLLFGMVIVPSRSREDSLDRMDRGNKAAAAADRFGDRFLHRDNLEDQIRYAICNSVMFAGDTAALAYRIPQSWQDPSIRSATYTTYWAFRAARGAEGWEEIDERMQRYSAHMADAGAAAFFRRFIPWRNEIFQTPWDWHEHSLPGLPRLALAGEYVILFHALDNTPNKVILLNDREAVEDLDSDQRVALDYLLENFG